jgi:hypothetical protein
MHIQAMEANVPICHDVDTSRPAAATRTKQSGAKNVYLDLHSFLQMRRCACRDGNICGYQQHEIPLAGEPTSTPYHLNVYVLKTPRM